MTTTAKRYNEKQSSGSKNLNSESYFLCTSKQNNKVESKSSKSLFLLDWAYFVLLTQTSRHANSNNVTQASLGIGQVNEHISESTLLISDISDEVSLVNKSASEISSSSANVENNANELKTLANELYKLISRFKYS